MSKPIDEKQSRRDFLRGSARYLTLGGLVFIGGALFTRRKTSAADGKCINLGICRGCSIFKSCSLPLALSIRQNQASIILESEKR